MSIAWDAVAAARGNALKTSSRPTRCGSGTPSLEPPGGDSGSLSPPAGASPAPPRLFAVNVRLLGLDLAARPCRTRLPFRFGIATMTEAPMVVATARVGTEAGEVRGYAAELLVPKWFAKDPGTSHDEDRARLVEAARRAARHVAEGGDASVFRHWLRAQRDLVEGAEQALVPMFGVALVERALIDAVCRARGAGFAAALAEELLGFDAGAVDPALDGWTPGRLGPRARTVALRHTVGLADDLDETDLDGSADRSDGHPLTLAEDIARYGLTCFKVKVCGDPAVDTPRLRRIAALVPDGALVTLDGNEQYGDPGGLADALDELERAGGAERLLAGLVSVEQPVSRARTFDPGTAPGVRRLAERAPVIIDEADATLDALPRARALGYGGASVKACKGVLRALVTRARMDVAGGGLQSAEDLTNLPPWPLLQDLALVSTLGLPHVERNGHHYFRGAGHLSADERAALAERHGDLFDQGAHLRIEGGALALDSLDAAGFGTDIVPDPAAPTIPLPAPAAP